MFKLLRVVPVLISLILTSSCQNFTFLPKEEPLQSNTQEKKIKNGLKKTYKKNGELYSEVNFKNGVKHGLSKSYYSKEKVQLAVFYRDGKKDSTSTLYYHNGAVKRTTQYNKGKKHGVRQSYFKNGNPSAQATYYEDMPATDLVEFYKSGNKIKQPKLRVVTEDRTNLDGTYAVKFYFNGKPEKAEFYLGELKDGKYFDKMTLESIPMNESKSIGTLTGQLYPGSFLMKKLHVVGKLETNKGNYLVRETVYNLALGG